MKRANAVVVSALALSMLLPVIARGGDFYVSRLEEGKALYRSGNITDAISSLRTAAFGLGDQPDRLLEALVVLAVADIAAGREADAMENVTRFLDAEREIKKYRQLELAPDIRAKFDERLREQPADALARIPSLAYLTKPAPKVAVTSPGQRRAALENAEKRNPKDAGAMRAEAKAAPSRTPLASSSPAAVPQAAKDHAAKTAPPAPPVSQSHAPVDIQSVLARSRELVEQRRAAEAIAPLEEAVAAAPGSRALRLALLQASAHGHQWKTGADQIRYLDPFLAGEEVWMFYAGVVAYETGDMERARRFVSQARTGIASSAYVEAYVQRILGPRH